LKQAISLGLADFIGQGRTKCWCPEPESQSVVKLLIKQKKNRCLKGHTPEHTPVFKAASNPRYHILERGTIIMVSRALCLFLTLVMVFFLVNRLGVAWSLSSRLRRTGKAARFRAGACAAAPRFSAQCGLS